MTEQEVFDKVWNHILTQGVPSVNETGRCLYRGPNGTMCAAGIFLTDEQAAFGDNRINSGWSTVQSFFPELKDLPRRLIGDLQECHDIAVQIQLDGKDFIQEFMKMAVEVAKDYFLTVPSVE